MGILHGLLATHTNIPTHICSAKKSTMCKCVLIKSFGKILIEQFKMSSTFLLLYCALMTMFHRYFVLCFILRHSSLLYLNAKFSFWIFVIFPLFVLFQKQSELALEKKINDKFFLAYIFK